MTVSARNLVSAHGGHSGQFCNHASDSLEAIVDEVLAANAKSVEQYRAGKEAAINALIGQAMKASKGKANPAQVTELLKKKLTS